MTTILRSAPATHLLFVMFEEDSVSCVLLLVFSPCALYAAQSRSHAPESSWCRCWRCCCSAPAPPPVELWGIILTMLAIPTRPSPAASRPHPRFLLPMPRRRRSHRRPPQPPIARRCQDSAGRARPARAASSATYRSPAAPSAPPAAPL